MTKISSNSRTKLKHLGYSIVSKYDTLNQTSTHEIFKANNSNNSKLIEKSENQIEKKISSTSLNVENLLVDITNRN